MQCVSLALQLMWCHLMHLPPLTILHPRPQLSTCGPWLCRLLQRSDWFTQEKACRLLAAILGARPDKDGSKAPSSGAGSSSGAPVSAAAEGVHATQVSRYPSGTMLMQCSRKQYGIAGSRQATRHCPAVQASARASFAGSWLLPLLMFVRLSSCQVAFVEWLCAQLRRPSHQTRAPAAACTALGTLLREPSCRQLFTRAGEAHRQNTCNMPAWWRRRSSTTSAYKQRTL